MGWDGPRCARAAQTNRSRFLCVFQSKPVGGFAKGCTSFCIYQGPFLFRASSAVLTRMPLLCICGAKSPFAGVFTIVPFLTGPYIPLPNRCTPTLSPQFVMCTVSICSSCWQY